jgi:hypothetical protein
MCDWIEKDVFDFPVGKKRFIYTERLKGASRRGLISGHESIPWRRYLLCSGVRSYESNIKGVHGDWANRKVGGELNCVPNLHRWRIC